jgi:hypothetical protein
MMLCDGEWVTSPMPVENIKSITVSYKDTKILAAVDGMTI